MFDRNSLPFPVNRVAGPWITPLALAAFFLAAFTVDSRAADPDTGQAADGAELSLYDSITFDVKLSNALGKKLPAVTVRSVVCPDTVGVPDKTPSVPPVRPVGTFCQV